MGNWYIKAGTVFDDPACKFYVYCDLNGYDEDDYTTQTDADIEADDPYIKMGGTGGEKEAVIGINSSYRIRITDTGVEAWDVGTAAWVDLIAGGIAGNIFKKIDCPLGTDPLAVGPVDTLILTSGNNILTITGDSATNTIDFVVVEGNITHNNLGGIGTNDHHVQFENVVEDTSPELGGELDALTEKIVNLGDPTEDYDAVNYHTLLDSMNITLHYYLQGSNVMSTTVIDSEATDSETINTSPDTMSNLFYKSTLLDTPAPFEVVADTVIIIHTKMNVDATLAHKTFKVKFQLGYVDADGTTNFSQIGNDSDYTETLTTIPTTYNIHLHVPANHAIVAGKRLWLKVIAVVVNNTPPNYPDLVIYRDSPNQHLTIPVPGSILQNFLKNVSEDPTPTLGGELDADSNKIVNLTDPDDNQDAATKKYVDDNKYTDVEAVSAVETGTDVTFSSFPITPSAEPDADYEVANKKYVDDNAGADVNAIHVNADSEISGIANKATPVDADYLVIEDSEDGNDKKHITIGDLPGGSGEESIIHPDGLIGQSGFLEGVYAGRAFYAPMTDVNASVNSTFFVKDGGTFKILIIYMSQDDNTGDTASGQIYLGHHIDGGSITWNEFVAVNADLPFGAGAVILKYYTHATSFTVADNSLVLTLWRKDNNAGGASGNMWIFDILLVRQ